MKILHVFSFLILIITQSSHASNDSIGEPDTVWKKRSISVCWGSFQNIAQTVAVKNLDAIEVIQMEIMKYLSTFGAFSKTVVQQTIQKEYNDDRIGITFTGWNDCTEKTTADVVIFAIKDTPFGKLNDFLSSELPYGQATIGEAGEFDGDVGFYKPRLHRKPFVFLRQVDESEGFVIPSTDALRLTAIHEFGHLLGLRHEHARDEAANDPNCRTTRTSVIKPFGEDTDISTSFYGVYDPNSIMNYCHIRMLKKKTGLKFATIQERNLLELVLHPFYFTEREVNFIDPSLVTKKSSLITGLSNYSVKIGLSQGDVHALRCMYNYYGEEDAERICKPSFNPLK